MTRKKIGIYCTTIWGNNNKTHRRCRCHHPAPSPLDLGCAALPQPGGWTERPAVALGQTCLRNSLIRAMCREIRQRGPGSAWKRAREDPARLEWVQTAAWCRQSHLPLTRGCQPAGSWLPGTGRSCQPGLVTGWGACTPLPDESRFPPVPPLLPSRSFS